MKIGLISDVHGNRVALKRVLDAMPAVDRLVCAGDVVGYNPWPGDCVDIVREVCDATVRGNHDRMLATPDRYRANPMAYEGLVYAAEHLSDGQREWVEGLPERTTVAGAYLLVHSHPDPARRDAYVYPEEFPSIARQLEDHRGCILGHTHVQGAETVDGTLVVNPGSVGQPRDGDPRAAFAVLDTEAHEVELHRVEYDVGTVQEMVKIAGLPDGTAERLESGR